MHWIAYDAVLKRPGCPILQAIMGGENLLPHHFPPETWLLEPTDNLKLYKLDDNMLLLLEGITKDEFNRQNNPAGGVPASP